MALQREAYNKTYIQQCHTTTRNATMEFSWLGAFNSHGCIPLHPNPQTYGAEFCFYAAILYSNHVT